MKNHFRQITTIILSTVAFLGLNPILKAQYDKIQLAGYKNPDYRYQMLDLAFDLGSNYKQNSYAGWEPVDLSKSGGFNCMVDAVYQSRSNHDKYQGEQSTSLRTMANDLWSSRSYQGQKKFYSQQYSATLQGMRINRFYFKPGYFFEVDPSLSASFTTLPLKSWSYDDNDSLLYDDDETDRYGNIGGSVALMIGKGRIEQVDDAAMAAYILEDLRTLKRLNRTASQEDLYQLAALITRLRSSRFFDNRIRKIREITAIDSLLNQTGLRSNADISYFSAVYDNWLYVNTSFLRGAGYRLYAGIIPELNYIAFPDQSFYYNNSVIQTKATESYFESNYHLSLGFKYEHPVNLKWQESLDASLNLGLENSKESYYAIYPVTSEEKYVTSVHNKVISSKVLASAGYYPTTRSNLNASVFARISYYQGDIDYSNQTEYAGKSEFNATMRAALSMNHYFSERLRLNLTLSVSYDTQNKETGKTQYDASLRSENRGFDIYFRSRLIYSLF